jgi:acetyltransferase
VGAWTAKDGTEVTLRPILPEDEGLLVQFHKVLSERTVYLRYLHPMMLQDRIIHERLARISHCDYDRDIPLLAEKEEADGSHTLMGVGRLSRIRGTNDARLSVLIADPYQGIGLGGELIRRCVDIARQEKLDNLTAIMTVDNQSMQHIFQNLGFVIEPTNDEKLVSARLKL